MGKKKKNKNKNKKNVTAEIVATGKGTTTGKGPTSRHVETREDFLSVDATIPGQQYTCLSFLSPDALIKKKEMFYMMHLLRDIFAHDDKINELKTNVKNGTANYTYMTSLYDDFVYINPQLQTMFDEQQDYKTNVRGIKIRGTYSTRQEAEVHAKRLQQFDKNFNIYVGEVGHWLPWDPDPDAIEGQEYGDGALNTLMHKYRENKEERDQHYQMVKENKMQDAAKISLEQKKKNIKETAIINGTDSITGEPLIDEKHEKKIRELRNIADEKETFISNTNMVSDVAPTKHDNNQGHSSLFVADDPWMQAKNKKNI
jgi:hypothetical protein